MAECSKNTAFDSVHTQSPAMSITKTLFLTMRTYSVSVLLTLISLAFYGCPQMVVEKIRELIPPPGYRPNYMTSAVPYDSLAHRYREQVRAGKVDTTLLYDQEEADQMHSIDSVLHLPSSAPVEMSTTTRDSLSRIYSAYAQRMRIRSPFAYSPSNLPGSDSTDKPVDANAEPVRAGAPIVLNLRSLEDNSYPQEIRIRCTVCDSAGRVVLGLAPPYLKDTMQIHRIWTTLIDSCGAKATAITNFTVREVRGNSDQRHALAFIIDHSGSMGDMRIRRLREAVKSTMNIIHTGDMVSVLPFAGTVAVDVPLSADSAAFKSHMSIENHAHVKGGTAIYDAVIAAVQQLNAAPAGYKKSIMLFTDGEDNSSKQKLSDAIRVAHDSSVAIYAISYGLTDEEPLAALSRSTGGKLYRIYSTREFPYMFRDIYNSLRNYYLIRYQPPECSGIHHVNYTVALPELGVRRLIGQARYDKSRFGDLDTVGSISYLNLHFATNKSAVPDSSKEALQLIASDLLAHPRVRLEVRGYTDDVGSREQNLQLSQMRATEVVNYLVSLGVSPGRLVAVGYGSSRPLVPNTSAENRAINRRTEFVIISK